MLTVNFMLALPPPLGTTLAPLRHRTAQLLPVELQSAPQGPPLPLFEHSVVQPAGQESEAAL